MFFIPFHFVSCLSHLLSPGEARHICIFCFFMVETSYLCVLRSCCAHKTAIYILGVYIFVYLFIFSIPFRSIFFAIFYYLSLFCRRSGPPIISPSLVISPIRGHSNATLLPPAYGIHVPCYFVIIYFLLRFTGRFNRSSVIMVAITKAHSFEDRKKPAGNPLLYR